MPSEKFKKLLRDTSKLKEAKEICENAGYKVSNPSAAYLNSNPHGAYCIDQDKVERAINSCLKYLPGTDDGQVGQVLCSIITVCTDVLRCFSEEEYYEDDFEHQYARELAVKVSDNLDDIKKASDNLQDIFAGF